MSRQIENMVVDRHRQIAGTNSIAIVGKPTPVGTDI